MNINKLKIALIILTISFPLNFNFAQTLGLENSPSDNIKIDFRFEKTTFNNSNFDYSNFSGTYNLSLNIPISSKFNLKSTIPVEHIKYTSKSSYSSRDRKVDQTEIGNIFLGLQTNNEILNNRRTIFTFGVYLPTANDAISLHGLFGNYYSFQSFMPNSWGVYINVMHEKISEQGFGYSIEAGPNVVIPSKESYNNDAEIFLHYGLSLSYQINKIMANLEITGIAVISEDYDDFSDRFLNNLNFGIQWKGARVVPRIYHRIYLREYLRDMIDGVWGFGLSVAF